MRYARMYQIVLCAIVMMFGHFASAEDKQFTPFPNGTRITIGPTLVHVSEGKFNYKIWVYHVVLPGEKNPADRWGACLAIEGEQVPELKDAALRSFQQSDLLDSFPGPFEGQDNFFEAGSIACFPLARNAMIFRVKTSEGEHRFCCVPMMCYDRNSGKSAMLHLAGPISGKQVKVKGRDDPYYVAPRCKELAKKQFETKAFGNPDPEIFKLDPDLLMSVPRPE